MRKAGSDALGAVISRAARRTLCRFVLPVLGMFAAALIVSVATATASSYTITPGGASVTAKTTTSGENATLRFSGTAGQRVSLKMANVTIGTSLCCSTKVSIIKPDGTNLVAPTYIGRRGGFFDTRTLPVTGTYRIFVDPQGTVTGSMTLTLFDVPPDASPAIAADANPVTATTTVPGQNMRLPFTGTMGQKVSLAIGANAIGTSTTSSMTVSILKPDGTALTTAVTMGSSGGFVEPVTLPVTGVYTILVDPQKMDFGSLTVTAYDVPANPSLPITAGGSAVTLTTTAPGQNAYATFTGTLNQRVSVGLTNASFSGPSFPTAKVTILKPDGTALFTPVSFGNAGYFVDLQTLPVAGTYKIFVDPQNTTTGNVDVTLYTVPADVSSTIASNGSPVSVATTTPGQNAKLTFSGTAGQTVTVTLSNVTIGSDCCSSVGVYVKTAAGATVANSFFGTNGGSFQAVLPSTATYTIFVDPQGAATGGANIDLS